MTAYPTKVEPSSRYMGDTEREHACRLLSCYSVRSLLFASYYGFSVDEVDASPLPATRARTIPVESKERPLMWRNADALASDASAKKGTWIRSKDDSATVVNQTFAFLPSKERMPSTACCCQRIDLALHQIVYHKLHQNDIYNAGNTAKTCHSKKPTCFFNAQSSASPAVPAGYRAARPSWQHPHACRTASYLCRGPAAAWHSRCGYRF